MGNEIEDTLESLAQACIVDDTCLICVKEIPEDEQDSPSDAHSSDCWVQYAFTILKP